MDSEDKFWLGLWVCVAVVILGFTAAGVLAANLDHDFDRTCITSGKSITYIVPEGNSSPQKVCK